MWTNHKNNVGTSWEKWANITQVTQVLPTLFWGIWVVKNPFSQVSQPGFLVLFRPFTHLPTSSIEVSIL